MAKSSILEIEKIYQALKDDVQLDVQKIDQLLNDAEKYLSKIESDKYDNDTDAVVTLNLSQQLLNTGNKRMAEQKWKIEEKIDFRTNITLEHCLQEESFGERMNSSPNISKNCILLYAEN